DADLGPFRLDLRAQLAHDLPGDLDPAAKDQVVAMPARPDAGVRQEFVETLHTPIVSSRFPEQGDRAASDAEAGHAPGIAAIICRERNQGSFASGLRALSGAFECAG